MKLFVILLALLLPLISCDQQQPITEEQATQLEQKIDELNSRLDKLENTGAFKTLDDSMQFLEKHKSGSERAACILNIRNIHQAVRSYQGLNGLNMNSPLDWNQIIGKGKFLEQVPVCPSGGKYIFPKVLPKIGTTAASCSHAENLKHHPDDTSGW